MVPIAVIDGVLDPIAWANVEGVVPVLHPAPLR